VIPRSFRHGKNKGLRGFTLFALAGKERSALLANQTRSRGAWPSEQPWGKETMQERLIGIARQRCCSEVSFSTPSAGSKTPVEPSFSGLFSRSLSFAPSSGTPSHAAGRLAALCPPSLGRLHCVPVTSYSAVHVVLFPRLHSLPSAMFVHSPNPQPTAFRFLDRCAPGVRLRP
jgi:hypothetical protein